MLKRHYRLDANAGGQSFHPQRNEAAAISATAAPAATAPPASSSTLHKEVVGVIPAVMQYDKKEFTVKPGVKVAVLFTNKGCPLQHNWILLKPGTDAAYGKAADDMIIKDPGRRAQVALSTGITRRSRQNFQAGRHRPERHHRIHRTHRTGRLSVRLHFSRASLPDEGCHAREIKLRIREVRIREVRRPLHMTMEAGRYRLSHR